MAFPDGLGNEFNVIFVHERSELSFRASRGLQNNAQDESFALCVVAKVWAFKAHI